MAAPPNLGFETAGAGAGAPDGWFLSGLSQAWLACAWRSEELESDDPTVDAGAPFASPNDFTTVWTAHNVTLLNIGIVQPPGGSPPSTRIRDSGGTVAHYVEEPSARPFLAGVTYTIGAFMLGTGGGNPFLGPRVDFSGTVLGASAQTPPHVTQISAAAAPVGLLSARTLDVGDDWSLISMSFKMAADASGKVGFSFNAGGVEAYAGANLGHYLWGAFAFRGELVDAERFDNGWATEYFLDVVAGENGLNVAWGDGSTVTTSVEAFEGGWGNTPYFDDIVSGELMTTPTGPWESFEGGWDNDAYVLDVTGTLATFNTTSTTYEAFEREWSDNQDYVVDVAGTEVLFDGPDVSQSAENFEECYPDVLAVCNAATDTFTAASHGMPNGLMVRVVNEGGAFPEPLVRTLDYFVINTATNTFKLSLIAGGASVDETDDGTGDLYIRASGIRYWWGPDFNPTL